LERNKVIFFRPAGGDQLGHFSFGKLVPQFTTPVSDAVKGLFETRRFPMVAIMRVAKTQQGHENVVNNGLKRGFAVVVIGRQNCRRTLPV
jgi:hypothetical protein